MTQGVDVERSVGLALKRATAALRAAMDDALRPSGLSVSQYACLEQLSQRPGLSAAELARQTFVTRQSAHALLQGLEDRGLLERPDEAPVGRALPVSLTADGRALLRSASRAVAGVEERMLAGLSGEAVDGLLGDLRVCAEALGEVVGPAPS